MQDFGAFLLAAAEADVELAFGESRVEFEEREIICKLFLVLEGGHCTPCLRDGVEEMVIGDAGYFDGVLECEEESCPRAFIGFHREEVFAIERDGAFGDGVVWVSGECLAEGAFAGAVGSHYRVEFARFDRQREPFEYLFAADSDV